MPIAKLVRLAVITGIFSREDSVYRFSKASARFRWKWQKFVEGRLQLMIHHDYVNILAPLNLRKEHDDRVAFGPPGTPRDTHFVA
jgi:hypothetical protein